MTKPTLVIMAAGMGSRYGGLKQLDRIGPNGETIIEYSIYDAIKAGIDKVVFIIKKEIFDDFRDIIGNKIEEIIDVDYIFQEMNSINKEKSLRFNRVKPWGTAHAILCCKDVVKNPFIVINADDFYGRGTYDVICKALQKSENPYEYFMAGFKVENTLTDFGSVSRGICNLDEENYLVGVDEQTKIEKIDGKIYYEEDKVFHNIKEGTLVSMNIWGLKPTIFNEIEKKFNEFLENDNKNREKDEFYIPVVIDELIKENKILVKSLKTEEQWYGITYKEDRERVSKSLKSLSQKMYPDGLWEEFK